MRLIKPPQSLYLHSKDSLFLAGSIEQGKARDWQAEVIKKLSHYSDDDLTIINPRRDDWDPTIEQSIDDATFRWQVQWELNGLDYCTKILFVLDPETLSPISLLEFGLHIKDAFRDIAVVCPLGFWRKGNIDIVSVRYGVPVVETIDEALKIMRLI